MHPEWLSNAYAIADREGGVAVFVDSGADVEPLVDAVERWGAKPVALLRTHAHGDHVEHEDELVARYGIPVVAEPGEWEWEGLRVRGVATPGHSDDMVAFVVFMALPDGTRVLPGHTDETTIGREREHNPFVRVWSGAEPEGSERVRVAGRDATLVVWSPDYDGNGKAWVRFEDGTDAIVGGSRVERG